MVGVTMDSLHSFANNIGKIGDGKTMDESCKVKIKSKKTWK